MAGKTLQHQLEKLVRAWNESLETKLPKAYKGLTITYSPSDWRLAHPGDFPEYYERERAGTLTHDYSDYIKGDLPSNIVKMLLTQEVSLEAVESFITYLIQEKDKRMDMTLQYPRREEEPQKN